VKQQVRSVPAIQDPKRRLFGRPSPSPCQSQGSLARKAESPVRSGSEPSIIAMLREPSMQRYSALVVMLPILCALPARGAEDVSRVEMRSYSYRPPAEDFRKSARLELPLQGIGAPVLTTIAPESGKSSQATGFPERRGALEEMLQSHEFSIGNSRARVLGMKGTETSAGVDLESVKVRISRNRVLIRAQFLFN
jgi:hypothetical protein